MKKSDIRQIIKEEVINLIREQYLTEAFADPELAKLSKMRGLDKGRWSNFFKNFANTHDIAWDKLPAGTLQKSTNMNDPLVKKGLAFWMIDNEKPNPYGGASWMNSYTLYPGVLAATLNGKIQYMTNAGVTSKGGRGTSPGSAVGQAGYGMLMVNKLKKMADHVLVMDFESFRGGTTALKAKRADLKLGKDTFKDHRAWKRANMERYKQILDARVGTRDQVDGMVAKIVKIANEAVATGMETVKMGKYDRMLTTINGNEVELEVVTNQMSRALSLYAEYIRYMNRAEKSRDQYGGGDYEEKSAKDVAGRLKKMLSGFEKGDQRLMSRY